LLLGLVLGSLACGRAGYHLLPEVVVDGGGPERGASAEPGGAAAAMGAPDAGIASDAGATRAEGGAAGAADAFGQRDAPGADAVDARPGDAQGPDVLDARGPVDAGPYLGVTSASDGSLPGDTAGGASADLASVGDRARADLEADADPPVPDLGAPEDAGLDAAGDAPGAGDGLDDAPMDGAADDAPSTPDDAAEDAPALDDAAEDAAADALASPDDAPDDAPLPAIDVAIDAANEAAGDASMDAPADAAPGDTPPDAAVTAFYIGPTGLDTNPGTEALPWKTWSFALSRLDAGKTLYVLDGDYGPATGAGLAFASCGAADTACNGGACKQGTSSQRIRVLAKNERRARLLGPPPPGRAILDLKECRYWTVEGLQVEGSDDAAASNGIVQIDRGGNLELRRLVVRKNNRHKNSALVTIANATTVLVEEAELFQGHRTGITAWYSTGVVLRRNYINGGAWADLGGGYASSYGCTGDMDTAIDLWGSSGGIVENNVFEGACRGVAITTADAEVGPTGAGDSARVLGNIGMGNALASFSADSQCANASPCSADNRVVAFPFFDNNVSVGSGKGFETGGAFGLTVLHHTVIGPTMTGFHLWRSPQNTGLISTASVFDSVVVGLGAGTAFGFNVANQASWSVDHCDAFMNAVNYNPNDANVVSSLQVNPMLGACRVEIPAGTPLKGAGTLGGDIGATIRWRTQQGLPTLMPLWDPTTGQLPCGAIVPGVNDEATFPGGTCATFHARIGIAPGCGR
jgi:hypothetical protein